MRAGLACLLVWAIAGCSYLLPASWRAFRADPDDAAPAVTRALDAIGATVEDFDQNNRKITSGWASASGGALRKRERYVITWERDPKEATLTIYVRHEEQEQEIGEAGSSKWGPVSHDSDREASLLDAIERELKH